MIVSESNVTDPPIATKSSRRPLHKRIIQVLRRSHLYFGLFLFPWAILYGVTGFLFNHPTVFSDQPTKSFGRDALVGTPLDGLPTATEQAAQVVALLNEKKQPTTPFRLVGEAKYSREFAFATVKAEGQTVSVLVDVKNGQGTVRSAPLEAPKPELPAAPFAIGQAAKENPGGRIRDNEPSNTETLKLDFPLLNRVKVAIPSILIATGFPSGDITAISVPDLTFPLEADGQIWTATYTSAGILSGRPTDSVEKPEPSVRRFLTDLHLSHGYPGEPNARWFWAVVVDVMACVMCFWGLTGLLMWWQIKATRKLGAVVLALSAVASVALGMGMYVATVG